MFSSELMHDGQIKRLTVTRHAGGWEIREEHDNRLVRTIRYTDWHRVERAKELFVLQNQTAASAQP